MRYGELLRRTRDAIAAADGADATRNARELLSFASGKGVRELLLDEKLNAPDGVDARLQAVTDEYLAGKPLAYILGEWSFFGLPIKVNPDVLIPRDDTMAVTELALARLKGVERPRVLDLCTGSGCIGLAIAANCPGARVTLADISQPALQTAKENAAANKLTNRITMIRTDALQPPEPYLRDYDLVVSNPPYVTSAEMEQLPVSVRAFEPQLALDGGEDGLVFYRAICGGYRAVLKDGGWLCVEFGMGQQDAVESILRENQFEEITFRKDASGIIRAAAARKQEEGRDEYG